MGNEITPLRKNNKLYTANVSILMRADQKATIFVPDGCAVVVLVRGERPGFPPLDGQGEYEFDCPRNPLNEWPVAIAVIDSSHVKAWETIDTDAVGRILDRCATAVERRRQGLPFDNGQIPATIPPE